MAWASFDTSFPLVPKILEMLAANPLITLYRLSIPFERVDFSEAQASSAVNFLGSKVSVTKRNLFLPRFLNPGTGPSKTMSDTVSEISSQTAPFFMAYCRFPRLATRA